MRVVIFIGHKGVGTGAVHGELDEHELAQKAAIGIGCTLMVRGHQPFVITGEGTNSIEQRVRLAEKEQPDVALTCHFNAFDDPENKYHSDCGCEVLYHPADTESQALAMLLAPRIAGYTGVRLRHENHAGTVPRDSGRGSRILKYMLAAGIPFAYLEPLFLTDPGDRMTLRQPGYFLALSRAVADALELWWLATGKAAA